MFNPPLNRSVSPISVDLCPSGHTWTNLMFNHIARNLFLKPFHKKRSFRARPYQTHTPYQHIKQLGQLINTGFANHLSHKRYPRIPLGSPLLLLLTGRLHFHGAELIHTKRPIVQPDPLLTINHRSGGSDLHQNCRNQHHRRKQNQGCHRATQIHNPLHSGIEQIIQRHMANVDDRKPL